MINLGFSAVTQDMAPVSTSPSVSSSDNTPPKFIETKDGPNNPISIKTPPAFPVVPPAREAPASPLRHSTLQQPQPCVDPPSRNVGKSITAKPREFDGSREKYMTWWRTIILYIAGFEVDPTDQQKIAIALSYMTGDNVAGMFADYYVFRGPFKVATFAEFSAEVHRYFRPTALERAASRNKLHSLRQGESETVRDFILHMKYLVMEVDYHIVNDAPLLISILRNGVHNDIVEFVERSQPDLMNSHSFARWESALIEAENVLTEISERKCLAKAANAHHGHPGTSEGRRVPIDIRKARAEGRCFKCGGSWPCREHSGSKSNKVLEL